MLSVDHHFIKLKEGLTSIQSNRLLPTSKKFGKIIVVKGEANG
tara:strand:+ start:90492 stop:90620 length:129 start_codon:yes stop_codon:yes gene_type:complete